MGWNVFILYTGNRLRSVICFDRHSCEVTRTGLSPGQSDGGHHAYDLQAPAQSPAQVSGTAVTCQALLLQRKDVS